jgi:hypothetical protein
MGILDEPILQVGVQADGCEVKCVSVDSRPLTCVIVDGISHDQLKTALLDGDIGLTPAAVWAPGEYAVIGADGLCHSPRRPGRMGWPFDWGAEAIHGALLFPAEWRETYLRLTTETHCDQLGEGLPSDEAERRIGKLRNALTSAVRSESDWFKNLPINKACEGQYIVTEWDRWSMESLPVDLPHAQAELTCNDGQVCTRPFRHIKSCALVHADDTAAVRRALIRHSDVGPSQISTLSHFILVGKGPSGARQRIGVARGHPTVCGDLCVLLAASAVSMIEWDLFRKMTMDPQEWARRRSVGAIQMLGQVQAPMLAAMNGYLKLLTWRRRRAGQGGSQSLGTMRSG